MIRFASFANAKISLAVLLLVVLAGCAARSDTAHLAMQCDQGISDAYQELNYSASKGFDGTVSWVKAESLLIAATTQQQFEKYSSCIDKVRRARFYIRQSQL